MLENERIKILGRSMGRGELFLNGVIILCIEIAYVVFSILKQIPFHTNYEYDSDMDLNYPIYITAILLYFCYYLMSISFFGNNSKSSIEKYGPLGFSFRKVLLALSIIATSCIVQAFVLSLIIFKS